MDGCQKGIPIVEKAPPTIFKMEMFLFCRSIVHLLLTLILNSVHFCEKYQLSNLVIFQRNIAYRVTPVVRTTPSTVFKKENLCFADQMCIYHQINILLVFCILVIFVTIQAVKLIIFLHNIAYRIPVHLSG